MLKNKSSLQMMELRSTFDFFEGEADSMQTESVSIKGFVSVEKVDRQNEIASPTAFNISTFLNDGTVLLNHKWYKNKQGNEVAVGKVDNLVPSYISGEVGDEWIISDISTKSFVSNYPKAKVPELSIGDRGLFAFVTVTEPDVVKDVIAGKYNSFSWRGLTKKSLRIEGGEAVYGFDKIDLWEVSLVNIPVMNQSNYIVSKGIEIPGDLYVTQVMLPKSEFIDRDSVVDFLEEHALKSCDLSDNGKYVCSKQSDEEYDVLNSIRVKLGKADFILSPKKESNPVKSNSVKGEKMKLYTFDADTLNRMFPGGFNTSAKSVDIGGNSVEIVEVVAKEVKEPEAVEKTPDVDVNELISTALKSEIENLDFAAVTTALSDLRTRYDDLQAKFDALAAEKQETVETEVSTEAELESVKSMLSSAIEEFNKTQTVIGKVVETVANLGKAVPVAGQRTEAAKSVPVETQPTNDLSSYFTNVFKTRG